MPYIHLAGVDCSDDGAQMWLHASLHLNLKAVTRESMKGLNLHLPVSTHDNCYIKSSNHS